MRQRLISAAVLVPVVVIVFLLGNPWITIGFGLLAAGCAYETSRLVTLAGVGAFRWLATIIAGFAVAGVPLAMASVSGIGTRYSTGPHGFFVTASAAFGVVVVTVVAPALFALRMSDMRSAFQAWIGTTLAVAYSSLLVAVPAMLVLAPDRSAARPQPPLLTHEFFWLLFLVATVWSLDSFAYLAGKYHGRGRFMNHVSPNKTWSGAIGGTIAAVIVATAMAALMGESLFVGALLGLLIAVAAQAGDLTESMLKRAAGVKDSGSLLPGHGGFLDRLDSFLFAGPALFLALMWIQAGQPVPSIIPAGL